jgi:hypothetical protein
VGNTRLRFVLIDQESGVKTGRLRSAREGFCKGMGTTSGAVKMTLSALASVELARDRTRPKMGRI